MVTSHAIVRALDDAGYRLTEPRRRLAELIAAQPGHFSADSLFDESRRRHIGLTRATIFRSIEVLTRVGAIERIDLPGGEHALVACEALHHHHVVCSSCGRATPVRDCGIVDAVTEIARRTGYRVDAHRVEIFGVCPDCQAENPV